jgi:hypothetical protein
VHHVFISYSRSDADWVKTLVQRLEHRGIGTWLDKREIPVTLSWVDEVRNSILEARLLVLCDSPAARASRNCATELALARQAGKTICTVSVGSGPDAAASKVAAAASALGAADAARTELAVLARDWDRAGRPRSRLVSTRLRRRLTAGLADGTPPGASERAFLHASRTRSRRRLAGSVLVALLAGAAVLGFEIVNFGQKRITTANSTQAAVYSETRAALASITEEPYQGLGEAATRGGNESAVGASVISAALRYPVPDDGFKVGAAATRFAAPQIAGTVIVSGEHGEAWERPTVARNFRVGRPAADPAVARTRADTSGLAFLSAKDSGVVRVLRHGRLWRQLTYTGPPSTLALSPDGRELAAAVGQLVEIADLRDGAVRTVLRGALGPIRALAWSADGRELWALCPGFVESWSVRDGTVLIDEPSQAFEAVFPSASGTAAWAVGHDGELREIDTATGAPIATLRVPDTIDSGAAASDGSVAALSGTRGEWIVPLSGGRPRLVHVPGCQLGRPAFPDAATFFLPCLGRDLVTVSVSSAAVIGRANPDPAGLFSVAVMPRRRTLLIGDEYGRLFAQTSSGGASRLWASECGASITRIAVSPGEDAIAPVGPGTGVPGCTGRGRLLGEGAGWEFDHIIEEATPASTIAETAAFSRTGEVFAYGYGDGTIVLHSTANILPSETLTSVDGVVRDMYVDRGGELIVATEAGVVQRIPLCDGCVSNRALSRVAAARLALGAELGRASRAARP